MIAAYHLPALSDPHTSTRVYGRDAGARELQLPKLTPELLATQVDALISARTHVLADRPIAEIVEIVDHVAGRLLDPRDELRMAAVEFLPSITGYSSPMIRAVLDGMAADWRARRLRGLLKSEFGDSAILDGFSRSPDGHTSHVLGPELTTHFFSGNVPGVAVTSLIRALLVKSASLAKTAAGEPLLPALFARGIHEADPGLGSCLAVAYWKGGDPELDPVALARADAVIAYGGNEAVEAIRRRTPVGARFLGYGHKLSFAMVGRECLTTAGAARTARLMARDVALFDQQGCVSPHLVYVEESGDTSPAAWAELLARALGELEDELPRGSLEPAEATAIRQLRGEVEFAQISGSGEQLYASADGTAWTVIFDPSPSFASSCLNRVVRVKPLADLREVVPLASRLSDLLQTVGLAVEPVRTGSLARELAKLGVSRICPVGEMAWPPPTWHHDGRPPLRDLVRWCDLEV